MAEFQLRRSIFGLKKKDVMLAMDKLQQEFDERLREKDAELSQSRGQVKSLNGQLETMRQRYEELESHRAALGNTLLKAQEQADRIIDEARHQAEDDARRLSAQVEAERERLVDAKTDIRRYRQSIREVMEQMDQLLGQLTAVEEEPQKQAFSEPAPAVLPVNETDEPFVLIQRSDYPAEY